MLNYKVFFSDAFVVKKIRKKRFYDSENHREVHRMQTFTCSFLKSSILRLKYLGPIQYSKKEYNVSYECVTISCKNVSSIQPVCFLTIYVPINISG